MTDDDHAFGAGVTPPHRPRPLTASTAGEATAAFGEDGSAGERSAALAGEGESDGAGRPFSGSAGGVTSEYIVREDPEE